MTTRTTGRRLSLLAAVVLALILAAGLATGAAAKKKKKAGGVVDVTRIVAAPIPDASPVADGVLTSTIEVTGKQFKGTKIRDVNVTIQTTGSTAGPPDDSAGDLAARVTAPNGGTSWLFGTAALVGQSVGPLTFDDETPTILAPLGNGFPRDATEIGPPYVGTAQPDTFSSFGPAFLGVMDNGPVTGTWTLRVYDTDDDPVTTSALNSWGLVVVAGKPFKTK